MSKVFYKGREITNKMDSYTKSKVENDYSMLVKEDGVDLTGKAEGYFKLRLEEIINSTRDVKEEDIKRQQLKKKLVEIVYESSKLELKNITFPQTESLLQGHNIPSLTVDEIQVVLNLKRASQYILRTNDTGLDLLLGINYYTAQNESIEWGVLRYGEVGVSGTDYISPIPTVETAKAILDRGVESKDDAVRLMFSLVKSQLFWDGNKRTAFLYVTRELFYNTGEFLKLDTYKLSIMLNKYYNSEITLDELYYEDIKCL